MTGTGISRKKPPGLRDRGNIRGGIAGLKNPTAGPPSSLRQTATITVKTTTKAVCIVTRATLCCSVQFCVQPLDPFSSNSVVQPKWQCFGAIFEISSRHTKLRISPNPKIFSQKYFK